MTHTLHLVSHTHWDREWYLTFQQFRLKLVRLVDGLLEILAQDEYFRYYMLDGQTIVLEDYLQIRPENETVLREHVQSGRVLIGPWYILPDEFLVSPEATIRNLLEGDRVAGRFGPKMRVGYIPDPFGHIGQMPQILRGFGIDSASVMRGLADEPCEFWWQSPDGSRVLMANLREGYGNAAGILNSDLDSFVAEVRAVRDSLSDKAAGPHLLLMQGTDHMEPQPDTSRAVAYAAGRLDSDRLVHSTLPAYLQCLKETLDLSNLPVVQGELRTSKRHPLLPGVLSTRMWIKQRNRVCETLLERWAEPFSAWASLLPTGERRSALLNNPPAVLHQAWRLLLQCHPHDSICGCSIDLVHTEMRPRFDQVEQMGEEITRQSLVRLASMTSTENEAAHSAVVVYNPAGGPRTDLVDVVLETLPESGAFDLIDERGTILPYQMVGLGSSEIINMRMSLAEFRSSYRMVADGVLNGLKIQAVQVRREGSQVFLNIEVSENAAPNRPAWEHGRREVEGLLDDPGITTYNVRVVSASAARVLFTAPEAPGYGYRTIWVRGKPAESKPPIQLNGLTRALMPVAARAAATPLGQQLISRLAAQPGSKPPYRMENEYFRVGVEPDGTLTVEDKSSGACYSGLNRFEDIGDRGDTYNFSPVMGGAPCTSRVKGVRVEQGAVMQVLEIFLELSIPAGLSEDRKSRSRQAARLPVTCRVRLMRGVARIEVQTVVENSVRDHRLRVYFPAPFTAASAQFDGHFETVERPVTLPLVDDFEEGWIEQPRPEVPQRAFTAIANGEHGLMIANRGLPEVEVLKRADGHSEIALTLLRCMGWMSRDDFPERKGHAGPFLETPGAQMLGKWTFEYAILPFCPADFLHTCQTAEAYQAPLRAVSEGLHPGLLPASASLLEVEPAGFALSAVKACEDGQGWLARAYNRTGEALKVKLRPLLPYVRAARANLAEESLGPLPFAEDGSLSFDVGPHEIVTIRFFNRE